MTRIYTSIEIPRPVEDVFAYVTTPGTWPNWHPSSLGVSGATDHSLEVGEQVTEAFSVAGRRGTATWTVQEREPPHRWVISGQIANSTSGGVLIYRCSSQGNGTLFEREFVYHITRPLYIVLDWVLVRPRVQAESRQALRQLQAVLTPDERRVPGD